ncbi:MAG: malonyl-[acyl-carrier protein] O-methyltransferase [Pseudomonadota bacterium]|jgi:malonyl-CoA O-methyltransferase
MSGTPPQLRQDRWGDKIRRAFDRVAPDFAANDFFYREMARRMDERLAMVRITPARILDAGCALGADRLSLQKRYPDAAWIGVDQSGLMLTQGQLTEQAAWGFMRRLFHGGRRAQSARIAANMGQLPIAGQSIDLIWSNAAVHWLNQLPEAFKEFNRVLSVGGLLMFSTFGPDTLKQLRHAMGLVGRLSRIHDFTDMHDVGDMLVHAGFSDPVMDMETLTLTYADPWQALRELQRAGSVSANSMSPCGLTTKQFWHQVFAHWQKDAQGRYPLTFELVQGHAWKMAPRQHEDGRAVVNFMPRPGRSPRQG